MGTGRLRIRSDRNTDLAQGKVVELCSSQGRASSTVQILPSTYTQGDAELPSLAVF